MMPVLCAADSRVTTFGWLPHECEDGLGRVFITGRQDSLSHELGSKNIEPRRTKRTGDCTRFGGELIHIRLYLSVRFSA